MYIGLYYVVYAFILLCYQYLMFYFITARKQSISYQGLAASWLSAKDEQMSASEK